MLSNKGKIKSFIIRDGWKIIVSPLKSHQAIVWKFGIGSTPEELLAGRIISQGVSLEVFELLAAGITAMRSTK